MLSTNELKGLRAIGYNVARIMENKKVSTEQLAACLSCSEIHVQAILKGSTELDNKDLESIAQGLGVTVSDILEEPDDGIMDYNIHYMGKASSAEEMNKILDEVDFYVRLLNS